MTTATYTTTLKLAQFLNIHNSAPPVDNATKGVGTAFESIGTAESASQNYFLDNKAIIDGTYAIWSGGTTATALRLTETTHFILNKDKGSFVITTTGAGLTSGSALYAEYQYYTSESGINDTLATDAIVRAQNHIENECNTLFAVGNTATPLFGVAWQELQPGRGQYDRLYITDHFPIQIITTGLDGALTSTAVTVVVNSTNGFQSSGTAVIAIEQFSYTGKSSTAFTGVTRGVNGSTAIAHADDEIVTSHVVEMSLTEAASTATWETQEYLVDYGVNKDAGTIKLVNFDSVASTILSNKYPLKNLPDRVRISYQYGWSTIPEEIERLTLMLASKELKTRTVNRALIMGRDEFKPSMLNVDDQWIQNTLNRYTSYRSSRPT